MSANLDKLVAIFEDGDRYLSSIGMVTLYYAIAHYLEREKLRPLTRSEVEHFEGLRQAVKDKDDEDLTNDELQAVEFAAIPWAQPLGHISRRGLKLFLAAERNIQLDH